jgi:hypothetical protein
VSESFKSWHDATKITGSVVSWLFGWRDPRLLMKGPKLGRTPQEDGYKTRFADAYSPTSELMRLWIP